MEGKLLSHYQEKGSGDLSGNYSNSKLYIMYSLQISRFVNEFAFVLNGHRISLMYSKNTFCQGVCNDGGSHVETSSICAVPLGIV